jgi:hypothetical protein
MENFKILLIILFFLPILESIGQEEKQSTKIKSYKLYINGFYQQVKDNDYDGHYGYLDSLDTYLNKKKKYKFGIPSFAIEFQSNKRFTHEIELMPVEFNIDEESEIIYVDTTTSEIMNGNKNTFIESHFRYQVNYYFTKNNIVRPYIGISTKFFYNFERIKPKTTGKFKNTKQNIGLHFAISPSVSFNLSKKLSLDLNIPIGFYEFKLNMENDENPNKALEYQKTSKFIRGFMPKVYNIRIGFFFNI